MDRNIAGPDFQPSVTRMPRDADQVDLIPVVFVAGCPAMQIKLMQYRLPEESGMLWPRWVPHDETISPPAFSMTFVPSATTS